MEGLFSVMAPYAVGTLFGLFVGAQWAFSRGIVYGVSRTLVALEELDILSMSQAESQMIVKKLQEYQQIQDNQ